MISTIIKDVLDGHRPDPAKLEVAIQIILEGKACEVQIAGLLVSLATQPVDGKLLAAAARVMRKHRVAVLPEVRPLVDTCGTGGDGAGTFNISTAAALVVAAAGAAVAKHGNRGVSSKVGSADVLEAVGCQLKLQPGSARELLDATGFVFLFAPAFHPAMRHVGPTRHKLGVRTIFNLLGPLSNPALAEYQVLGVFDQLHTRAMADALQELDSRGALVVHCDGLDEFGLHAVTRGYRLHEGEITPFAFDPAEAGLAAAPISALQGGDQALNAKLMRASISGEAGPHADVVALNAGAALFVAGLTADIPAGVRQAQELMQSGKAIRVLDRYVESCGRLSGEAV